MSTEYATLARYIQQIAVQAPEIKSTLKTLRARGVIPGIYTEAGGIQDDERETCCDPENNGVIEDDPNARNPWTGTDGNAPEEYQSTPDGVTDCETGEAISVNFVGGFSQAETCKECGPDETWEEGWYWAKISEPSTFTDATAAGAARKNWADYEAYLKSFAASNGFTVDIQTTSVNSFYFSGTTKRYILLNYEFSNYDSNGDYAGGGAGDVRSQRYSCGSSTESYCTLTEAPEICGDNWESDSTTQYTIRNGCLVASKCDPDAPTSALGCNEELTLCKDGEQWNFRPTSNGGWIQYDPDGIRTGGKYDGRTGKRTAVIPPGQESMY